MADLGPLTTEEVQTFWGHQKRVVIPLLAAMSATNNFKKGWPLPMTMTMVKKLGGVGQIATGFSGGQMIGAHFDKTVPQYGIYGTVTYEDNPGAGLKLRLYSRDSGELLAETTSDGSGNYDFDFRVPQGYKYYVVAFDSNLVPIYNAKIRDFLDPRLI